MSSAEPEKADVVVIGGGLAGLTAAWRLRHRRVVLLESTDRLGGRLMSERRGDVWLNFGAHVFGGAASPAGRLIEELALQARDVPGRLAAAELHGRVAATGPVEALPFKLPLSLSSRVALLRAGARLRLAVRSYGNLAMPRPGDDPATRQRRLLAFLDDRTMAEFLGPLPADVDGLFRATLTRSSGEPEELQAGYGVGYFHLVWDRKSGLSRNLIGGSETLVAALRPMAPVSVRTGAEVVRVTDAGDVVEVRYRERGVEKRIVAAAAVVACPAYAALAICNGIDPRTQSALAAISYGPYVVASFLTEERRPMPWDSIYALATPRRSFNMLFNIANVLRGDKKTTPRQGSLMVYAAADLARGVFSAPDEEIERRFLDDLFAIFPDARRSVREIAIKRWEHGLPYPRPGRARLQDALLAPQQRVHLAGDYLGTSYTDTAVWTAELAAWRAEANVEASADMSEVGRLSPA